MKKHKEVGFIAGWGLWCPQVLVQITPFFLHFGFSISKNKLAVAFGPLAFAIFFGVEFRKEYEVFNDHRGMV